MAMKVYGLPMSTNVARHLMCLEEVRAQYEVVPIDFSKGEHKGTEHTARNPFGQVPALQDGDMTLFGEMVLCNPLVQSSLLPFCMVDMWLEVESQQFDRPISVIIYQCLIVPVYFGRQTDEKVVEENLDKVKKTFEVYEARLSKYKYLAGDFISLADLGHFPTAYYMLATPHAPVLDEYPHGKAWITDMLTRPTVTKVTEMMKATA